MAQEIVSTKNAGDLGELEDGSIPADKFVSGAPEETIPVRDLLKRPSALSARDFPSSVSLDLLDVPLPCLGWSSVVSSDVGLARESSLS